MGRRRARGGLLTITADVEVDVSEVLDECDTSDLVAELRVRSKDGDKEAVAYLQLEYVQARDLQDLAHLVATGQAQELLALLTRMMRPHKPLPGSIPLEALPRCITTRSL